MTREEIQKDAYRLKVMGRKKPSKRTYGERVVLRLITFLLNTIY